MGNMFGSVPRVKYPEVTSPPTPPAPSPPPGITSTPSTTQRGYGFEKSKTLTDREANEADEERKKQLAGLEARLARANRTVSRAKTQLYGRVPYAEESGQDHYKAKDALAEAEHQRTQAEKALKDFKAGPKKTEEKKAAATAPQKTATPKLTTPSMPSVPTPTSKTKPKTAKTLARRSSFEDSFRTVFHPGAPAQRRPNLGRG